MPLLLVRCWKEVGGQVRRWVLVVSTVLWLNIRLPFGWNIASETKCPLLSLNFVCNGTNFFFKRLIPDHLYPCSSISSSCACMYCLLSLRICFRSFDSVSLASCRRPCSFCRCLVQSSSHAVSIMYGFLCWGGIGVKQVKAASISIWAHSAKGSWESGKFCVCTFSVTSLLNSWICNSDGWRNFGCEHTFTFASATRSLWSVLTGVGHLFLRFGCNFSTVDI